MIKLALLGKDIQHSKSPEIYSELYKGQVKYSLIDKEDPEDIPSLKEIFNEFSGLSITSPYKRHFLTDVKISDQVKKIGAINCIRKNHDASFEATNTDYIAFKEIFSKFERRSVVLLGSGAMTQMIKTVFNELGTKYIQLSRKTDGDLNRIDYSVFEKDGDLLIINACARSFHFSSQLSSSSIFWDMNYSHSNNKDFLTSIVSYIDGYELLYLQARAAKKFWNNEL